MKTEPNLIDWGLYGALVRNRRIKLGFKTAESFSAPLWQRTRVYISRDALYKIEQGRTPDAQQFMALNLVLFNDFFPMDRIIRACMSTEWEYIINHNPARDRSEADPLSLDLPEAWKIENDSGLAEVDA